MITARRRALAAAIRGLEGTLSVRAWARWAGVNDMTILKAASGERTATVAVLVRLADALDGIADRCRLHATKLREVAREAD